MGQPWVARSLRKRAFGRGSLRYTVDSWRPHRVKSKKLFAKAHGPSMVLQGLARTARTPAERITSVEDGTLDRPDQHAYPILAPRCLFDFDRDLRRNAVRRRLLCNLAWEGQSLWEIKVLKLHVFRRRIVVIGESEREKGKEKERGIGLTWCHRLIGKSTFP